MAGGGGVVALVALALLLDMLRKARRQQTGARNPAPDPSRSRAIEAWRAALEQAGPIGRRPDRALEPAEEVEEGESLEVMPREVPLEAPVSRAPRRPVDLDDESRLAVARRLRESAARDRPHSRADHREFDAKVREAAPQPVPPSHALARERMREAIKWQEILGRPVGWRDEE